MSITRTATRTATPILQFGTSRFLQAHADLFVSDAMARGRALGPITVVQSSGDAGRRGRLAALAAPGGFVVRVQGRQNGVDQSRDVTVTSVHRALTTADDWPEICAIAAHQAEIILSNTSDSGWVPAPVDGAAVFDQAMSYPAKLTHLLRARHAAGGRPIQVMPTELILQNGDTLRARVLALAHPLDADFADWVRHQVRFVNSLVDRIVSAPLEPAGAVAEPYALWAIQACDGLILPCDHPAVQVVDDLNRVERLKLHILNLGHTWMVADWLARAGDEVFVRQIMGNPDARARLQRVYEDEVLPGFAAHGYSEAPDYAAQTLERFANPYLDHRLSDIAQNHVEKMRRRIGAFVDWAGTPAPELRRLMAAIPND